MFVAMESVILRRTAIPVRLTAELAYVVTAPAMLQRHASHAPPTAVHVPLFAETVSASQRLEKTMKHVLLTVYAHSSRMSKVADAVTSYAR